jgi:hypothetical protein
MAESTISARGQTTGPADENGIVKVPNTRSLLQFMQSSPLYAMDDVDFARDKSFAREVATSKTVARSVRPRLHRGLK